MKLIDDLFNSWWIDRGMHRECDAIVFDIDGTLISGKRPLPGSERLISWLHETKYPFYLLTNDGNHSTEEKSSIMRNAGLDISPDDIVSCSSALKPYAEKNGLKGSKFFIMGDLGVPCYAEKAGLLPERDTSLIDSCDGVIVGEGSYDWQTNISAVMNFFIKKPKALLLVPNPDSYWPNGPQGEIGIGAGGKARFLRTILGEYGIPLAPIYFGKPYAAIFRHTYALLKSGRNLKSSNKRRVLMLGDSLRSDIKGAKSFGFSTALLLTGITKKEHLSKLQNNFMPELVFHSLA